MPWCEGQGNSALRADHGRDVRATKRFGGSFAAALGVGGCDALGFGVGHAVRRVPLPEPQRVSARPRYALERYSLVSVLIFTDSPSLMNGGTRTLRPVSHTASFITLVAVAFLIPGSVSAMVRVTA